MDIDGLAKASGAATEGTWHDATGLPGVRLKVLAANAPAASRAFRRYARAARDNERDENGMLTQEASEEIERKVLAEVVLVDWEGFESGKEAFPYSPENAAKLLDIALVRESVTQASERAALDNLKAIQALEKNS